jgi:hypothetical protein
MPGRTSYRELLEAIQDANRSFKNAFHEIGSWRSRDARGVAKARLALDKFHESMKPLFADRLALISKRLASGDLSFVDELIEFLSADIAAFRVGYAKERYYRQLKKLPLTEVQSEKLREIALARCASGEYRREDSELRRLMIRLADWDFLCRVHAIPSKPQSRIEGHKMRMMQVVLRNRQDLKALLGTENKRELS